MTQDKNWQAVCELDELINNIGVCALLDDEQVAIFKFSDDVLYAVSNFDPFSEANVLSRGMCGDLQGQPVVASPIYKQHFNLTNGQCLEDDSVVIPTYSIDVQDGKVLISK